MKRLFNEFTRDNKEDEVIYTAGDFQDPIDTEWY